MEQILETFSAEKREYAYYGEDGEILGIDSFSSLSEEDYATRMEYYNSWLESEVPNERGWRNSELTATDYMLIPDATYGGELVSGDRESDILEYRTQLRAYNLTTDDRPTRPEWFA